MKIIQKERSPLRIVPLNKFRRTKRRGLKRFYPTDSPPVDSVNTYAYWWNWTDTSSQNLNLIWWHIIQYTVHMFNIYSMRNMCNTVHISTTYHTCQLAACSIYPILTWVSGGGYHLLPRTWILDPGNVNATWWTELISIRLNFRTVQTPLLLIFYSHVTCVLHCIVTYSSCYIIVISYYNVVE